MYKKNNYVNSIMQTIKSSKICAFIIVASIFMIGVGTLTDAIDKVIKFNYSYMSKSIVKQKSIEIPPSSSKKTTTQISMASTIIVIVCIVIFFISLIVLFIRWRRNVLSFEIEHNLKLLHVFWNEFQGYLNKPLSMPEVFHGIEQIGISEAGIPITIASRNSIEHDVDLPKWQRKIFEREGCFDCLTKEKKQSTMQFYSNLGKITSQYKRMQGFGVKVAQRTNLKEM